MSASQSPALEKISQSPPDKVHWAWLAVTAIVVGAALWAVYRDSLNAPFIYDDRGTILENLSIRSLWPLVGDTRRPGPLNAAKDLPTSGRPLVNYSFALNYRFGGFDPWGYHFVNLATHWLSAVLLGAIAFRIFRLEYFGAEFHRAAGMLSFSVALIWAMHPLATESVQYTTQRTELFVGFFYLATLYCSLRYWAAIDGSQHLLWAVLASTACIAGACSKEIIVTAPVLVLLFERTFITGSFKSALRKSWPLYAALALSWVVLIELNYQAPRSSSAGFGLGVSAWKWWFTEIKVVLMYLKLAVWPAPLSIHYEIPYVATVNEAWPWVTIAMIGVGVSIFLLWRRNSVGYVAAWVLLVSSPTLVVPIITEQAADRRMYVPLTAIVALATGGVYWLLIRGSQRASASTSPRLDIQCRRPTLVLLLAASVAFSVLSWHRLRVYDSEVDVWKDVLANNSNNPEAYHAFGFQLQRAGRDADAIEQFQKALKLQPDHASAHLNMGLSLKRLGRLPEAIAEYRKAIAITPESALAHDNLGNALQAAGDIKGAIEQYRAAIALKPNFADAYNNLGVALLSQQHPQEAIEQFSQALDLKPDLVDANVNLGKALLADGRPADAVASLSRASRGSPPT